jgi:hypothetical protein
MGLQHRYRANSLKNMIKMLKETDKKHMLFVHKLKKVIGLQKQLADFRAQLE